MGRRFPRAPGRRYVIRRDHAAKRSRLLWSKNRRAAFGGLTSEWKGVCQFVGGTAAKRGGLERASWYDGWRNRRGVRDAHTRTVSKWGGPGEYSKRAEGAPSPLKVEWLGFE